jgi:hypothetical protein
MSCIHRRLIICHCFSPLRAGWISFDTELNAKITHVAVRFASSLIAYNKSCANPTKLALSAVRQWFIEDQRHKRKFELDDFSPSSSEYRH